MRCQQHTGWLPSEKRVNSETLCLERITAAFREDNNQLVYVQSENGLLHQAYSQSTILFLEYSFIEFLLVPYSRVHSGSVSFSENRALERSRSSKTKRLVKPSFLDVEKYE
ncbi:hypothetical protein R1flu_003487 [Riccia fluitans]|uniref:Uncharacterized protein n=1 Tax=Riccia fluitans TaxID=41844 RepID=A0ABD1YCL7_9MARC